VESPSLEIFQPCLDAVLCSLLWVTLLGQGVGLGDPQRALPTPNILPIILFFLILISLWRILVLGRCTLLEAAPRKRVGLCFPASVEGKRSGEKAVPLERQTLNTPSRCAPCIAPGQGAEDNESKASCLARAVCWAEGHSAGLRKQVVKDSAICEI